MISCVKVNPNEISLEFMKRYRSEYAYTREALEDVLVGIEQGSFDDRIIVLTRNDKNELEVVDGSRFIKGCQIIGKSEVLAEIRDFKDEAEKIKFVIARNRHRGFDPIGKSNLIYDYYVTKCRDLAKLDPIELSERIKYAYEKYKKENSTSPTPSVGNEYDMFLLEIFNIGKDLEPYIKIPTQWLYIALQNLSDNIKNDIKRLHWMRKKYPSIKKLHEIARVKDENDQEELYEYIKSEDVEPEILGKFITVFLRFDKDVRVEILDVLTSGRARIDNSLLQLLSILRDEPRHEQL